MLSTPKISRQQNNFNIIFANNKHERMALDTRIREEAQVLLQPPKQPMVVPAAYQGRGIQSLPHLHCYVP